MKKISFYIYWALGLLVLILAFTAVDYFFHSLFPEWSVPDYYFRNKIIFGFLLSIPAVWVSLKLSNIWGKALVFSLIISVLLQLRYYFEGYSLNFVLTFLLIHFLILYVLSSIMFIINKKTKI